ncbi:flagellar MS-ring protein [Planctomycetes bacterium CA13]|uniref:Flagellar MS-ring protein n=1 Tax=Novipirellula herctigrandis TaxID=2527986 RepID=A0A5C5Z992_9BACT|nr:flagellar MS-ring protein [Planctomycetes bacterium CA13]
MNFFSQSSEQMREAFNAMPMQSRIITALLVAAIAIGLGFLVRGTSSVNHEVLFGGRVLNENEIDAVELSFSHAGLNDWEREGRRIRIPRESRNAYLAALEESASLPVSLQSHVQTAINSASPFESSEQRLSREMHAKEQDLGSHLARFPDIKFASVEYDRAERVGLSRDRPQSASVVVTPEGTEPLSKQRIDQIKEMIRASYAGMSSDDVAVIDTNSDGSIGFDEDADPLAAKRRDEIAFYEQKIRKHLIGYGSGLSISVYAEIDPTMDVEKTTLKYDSERTTLQDKSRKIDTQTIRPLNQGVPGAAPNAIGNRAQSLEDLESTAQTSKTKEDERESVGVAGQQYENSRMASLQTVRVRASISLPQSYYQEVWAQNWLLNNPDKKIADVPPMRTADLEKLRLEVKTNIQRTVTPLLPEVNAGESKIELVEVSDYPTLPQPATLEPETAKLALTWLAGSWQTIAMIGLALVALLVARSAIRGSGSDNGVPSEFNEGFGLELPAPPAEVAESTEKNDAMEITGGTLKDELVSIVESNPEVAANVIRNWVADAA